MAQHHTLLSVLWIAVAIIVSVSSTTNTPTTAPLTTTAAASTTSPDLTTTAAASTTPPDLTTTTAASTTSPDLTTTAASTTPPDLTTTTAASTTPPDLTTTTAASTTSPDLTTTVASTTPKDLTTTTVASTTPPDSTTTTVASTTPPDSTTTVASTTPKDLTASVTSTTPGTADPHSSSSPVSPTPEPDACHSNPCGVGSTCQNVGADSFRCLCLTGEVYDEETFTCRIAKVFPGQLNVREIEYVAGMSNTESEEFKDASETITAELDRIFSGEPTYTGSTVLEIKPNTNAVSRSGTITASVQISFTPESDVKLDNVEQTMTDASKCDSCVLAGSAFTKEDLCGQSPCELSTTTCKSSEGSFTCSCKEGFINTIYSDRMCIATCPVGEHLVDSICTKCPFGYSGFNCQDNYQLILVIVGSVLGGLLLISLILLLVVSLKCSKKSSKKTKDVDYGKPYVSHSVAKAPLANSNLANSQAPSLNGSANAFTNGGVPRIPRATTNSAWDSRTNLEMAPSHSRQNLISEGKNSRLYEDLDDGNPYAVSRQSSLYAQRPQNNPYGQNRAQFNPYAQSHGHNNPYYGQESGRRLH